MASITFSLKFSSRALAAVPSDKLNSRWIAGTTSLREENEIRVLQYDADQERLLSARPMVHPMECWHIACSGLRQDMFMTVWSKVGTYGVSLWVIQPGEVLVQLAELPGHTGIVRSAQWHPTAHNVALTIEESALHRWNIDDQGVLGVGSAPAGELLQLWSGELHPLKPEVAATAGGNNVQLWDLRTMERTAEITGAHRMPVRDVCFAHQNEHRLVSCGDDCRLRFWDVRMLGKGEALLELGGHSHWVWRAQINPFHDQLVASSSSDCLVNLYHTPQLAGGAGQQTGPGSAAGQDLQRPNAGGMGGAPGAGPRGASGGGRAGDLDGKAHTFDDHEDSVYGLAWSCVDPWLFASLSYDGRVVINKVPKNIKYKILI